MKIAVISNQAFSLINFRGPLMQEMQRRGHQVFAFAPDFGEKTRNQLRSMGIQPVDCDMTRAGMNVLQELTTIYRIWRALRQIKPDATLAIFLKPVAYVTIAAWLAGIPRRFGLVAGLGFAFGPQEAASLHRRLIRQVVVRTLKLATAKITHLAFQNANDHEEAIELGLVEVDSASMIGATGVDLNNFRVAPLPTQPVTFILVARLLREKGILDYVEAAKSLKVRHPDARFLVLGGLDDNPTAIKRSDMDGWVADGIIEWPGHVPVMPWLKSSSVFVLPSYYREGVPRSTQEAMAIGRPIITADTPGCRETVIDGLNGILVPPRNPEALAKAMLHFIDHPAAIHFMGEQSRRLAEDRFDIHVQNNKLLGMMGI